MGARRKLLRGGIPPSLPRDGPHTCSPPLNPSPPPRRSVVPFSLPSVTPPASLAHAWPSRRAEASACARLAAHASGGRAPAAPSPGRSSSGAPAAPLGPPCFRLPTSPRRIPGLAGARPKRLPPRAAAPPTRKTPRVLPTPSDPLMPVDCDHLVCGRSAYSPFSRFHLIFRRF